ncbi:hypothetical protein Ancab_035987 [Ancistrocladus abbreviatus]
MISPLHSYLEKDEKEKEKKDLSFGFVDVENLGYTVLWSSQGGNDRGLGLEGCLQFWSFNRVMGRTLQWGGLMVTDCAAAVVGFGLDGCLQPGCYGSDCSCGISDRFKDADR